MPSVSRLVIAAVWFVALTSVSFLLTRSVAAPNGQPGQPAPVPVRSADRGAPVQAGPRVLPERSRGPKREPLLLARVHGKLVDDQSGTPMAGVRVQVAGVATRSTVTDGSGGFLMSNLPRGPLFRLQVGKRDPYLEEFIDVRIPREREEHDIGTIRLVHGDWQTRFGGAERGMTGLEHELRDGKMVVTATRPGTAAARARIVGGERVVAVDGRSMDGLGHSARTYFLQGRVGTKVTLLVESQNGQRRTVELEREARPGASRIPRFY